MHEVRLDCIERLLCKVFRSLVNIGREGVRWSFTRSWLQSGGATVKKAWPLVADFLASLGHTEEQGLGEYGRMGT